MARGPQSKQLQSRGFGAGMGVGCPAMTTPNLAILEELQAEAVYGPSSAPSAGDIAYFTSATGRTLGAISNPTPTTGYVLKVLSTGPTVIGWGPGGAGSGDVVGPASSTDNAVARFDSTTGKLLQDSVFLVDDSGNITGGGTYNGNTVDDATDPRPPNGSASGDLSGTYPAPAVAALTTTTGPTSLTIGAIADTEMLVRSGSTIIGATVPAGDVVGPGSSTDNAVARFDLATGKLLQNSVLLVDDSGNITGGGTYNGNTVDDATDPRPPNGSAGGDLGGTYPNPSVAALTTTTGPTQLTIGAIGDGQVLTRSGSTIVGAAGGGGAVPYAILSHRETSGTNGGTATLGAWRSVGVNNVDEDADSLIDSFTGPNWTLVAGTYRAYIMHVFGDVSLCQVRLYDLDNTVELGISVGTWANYRGNVRMGWFEFTIASDTDMQMEYQTSGTEATYGLGTATSYGADELFGQVVLWQLST